MLLYIPGKSNYYTCKHAQTPGFQQYFHSSALFQDLDLVGGGFKLAIPNETGRPMGNYGLTVIPSANISEECTHGYIGPEEIIAYSPIRHAYKALTSKTPKYSQIYQVL